MTVFQNYSFDVVCFVFKCSSSAKCASYLLSLGVEFLYRDDAQGKFIKTQETCLYIKNTSFFYQHFQV